MLDIGPIVGGGHSFPRLWYTHVKIIIHNNKCVINSMCNKFICILTLSKLNIMYSRCKDRLVASLCPHLYQQSTMVWKTMDGLHVPQQSYPHFVTLALKNFRASTFHCCRPPAKYFNDENFPIYGITYLVTLVSVQYRRLSYV